MGGWVGGGIHGGSQVEITPMLLAVVVCPQGGAV